MVTTDEESPDASTSGHAIVYMEDDKIIKYYPNGHKEILKTIDR